MAQMVEQKETNIAFKEQKQELDVQISAQINNIVEVKASLALMNENQMELEEKIYTLTGENAVRRTFKEKLIEILPELYETMQQGKNKPTRALVDVVNSLENNSNKAELLAMLQSEKLWKN